MVEYFIESLYEAIVYCIQKGFSESYIMDLDVWGFGKVYKYLRRIETRSQMSLVGLYSTANHGSKKDFKTFLDSIKIWLPEQEQNIEKKTEKDFKELVAKGGLR